MAARKQGRWQRVPLSRRNPDLVALVLNPTVDDMADRLLRACNGSAEAAHAAVTRAVKRAKDRPDRYTPGLLLAAALKRKQPTLSRREALLMVAKSKSHLRELEKRLAGRSLATFERQFQSLMRAKSEAATE